MVANVNGEDAQEMVNAGVREAAAMEGNNGEDEGEGREYDVETMALTGSDDG
jgi:hypothetical protein